MLITVIIARTEPYTIQSPSILKLEAAPVVVEAEPVDSGPELLPIGVTPFVPDEPPVSNSSESPSPVPPFDDEVAVA